MRMWITLHALTKSIQLLTRINRSNMFFQSPATISISGSTGSGKTSWLFILIEYKDQMFVDSPKKILYCFGAWQPMFERFDGKIEFHEGLPSDMLINEFADGHHHLFIIDDLIELAVQSSQVQNLFTKNSHHKNLTVIYINQNMFCKGKYARNLSINTQYMILFRSPRDVLQISALGAQVGLRKALVEAYLDCTNTNFGYLVLDLSPNPTNKYKLKTNIFPGEKMIVYVPL